MSKDDNNIAGIKPMNAPQGDGEPMRLLWKDRGEFRKEVGFSVLYVLFAAFLVLLIMYTWEWFWFLITPLDW